MRTRALILASLLAPSLTPGLALADPPIIPRAALFGNPTRTAATISPDGKRIAYLAPEEGVLNVWVAPADDLAQAKPVTHERERPIRKFLFSPDGARILYLQDKGGTEDFLLYGVKLDDGTETNYTPFEKTRAEILAVSPDVKDAILIGLNNRDPHWHDAYRLSLADGKLTLLRKGDDTAGFVADDSLTLRLAEKVNKDASYTIETIDPHGDPDGGTRKLFDIPAEDVLTTALAGIPKGADYVYVLDTRGRDTAALEKLSLASGEETVLAQDKRADIGGGLSDPQGVIHATSVDYLKQTWTALDDRYRDDIATLDREAAGQWTVTSQSDDDKLWTIAVDRVTEAPAFYLYDRSAKRLTKLFTTRPELEKYTLAAMRPEEIPSRDGKTLVSYLTLPAGMSDPPATPLPMVLFVHGGPWARDEYGYSAYPQWLANRGYAVLQVNYRGSSGFGKGFLAAGDKQWGAAMEDDLLDAVTWASRERVAERDRVAIMGGSYGGYATLAGVTMHPTEFACGVDIVGPSNLATLLKTIPPYWQSQYAQFIARVGDPATEAGQVLLKERSPLTYAEKIERPLLIGQGANDPRVNVRESDQIVAAMEAKSIPVTYVLYPDEGHGFARPENRLSFNAVAEAFLAKCLRGRFEPIGEAFNGASLEVKAGADQVPGLPEALQARARTKAER